jgi:hypothetical protein
VRVAVAQHGHVLDYVSEAQKDDPATVRLAVAQDGVALRYASAGLKGQYGATAAEFLANAPQQSMQPQQMQQAQQQQQRMLQQQAAQQGPGQPGSAYRRSPLGLQQLPLGGGIISQAVSHEQSAVCL